MMNMVMQQQTAQTRYHHQAHLHTMEDIILAQDTGLDPLLGIITGTDTGLADPDHFCALTGIEVTVKITHREVTLGHITDAPTEAHCTTDTHLLLLTGYTT